jgi:hypothetical protein
MSSGRRTVTATRHLVLLPAMLCDEELYRPQAEALAAEANVATLVIAEAGMAESAAAVLRQAPPQFVLAGTSYGANLAIQGQIVLVAMRGIAPGEELTSDWATTDDGD